ncbi:MAG: GNAT family N-acetyltransferase [Proteobacteria bacterium]|nr:GNAT family N-acetyltransferase [Pseudomonadota bacterium]MCP4916465.1 GNAT family N-acetyltransferase [Pseudomonadota bacterium]
MESCFIDLGTTAWALDRGRRGPLAVLTRRHGVLSPYDDVPAGSPPEAITRALGNLDADVLLLRAIPAESVLLQVPSILRLAHRTQASWSLDLRAYADANAWVASRSKGRRRSLRKGLKALGPGVRFEALEDRATRMGAIQHAIGLKRAWLEERGMFSRTFSSPAFRASLVERWSEPDPLLPVYRLAARGQTVAIELGDIRDGVHRAYMGAFDPRYDGAGVVMTVEAVRAAFERGLDTYDLLPPETDFKSSWMDQRHDVYSAIVPLSAAGRLAAPALRDGPTLAKRAVRFGEKLACDFASERSRAS